MSNKGILEEFGHSILDFRFWIKELTPCLKPGAWNNDKILYKEICSKPPSEFLKTKKVLRNKGKLITEMAQPTVSPNTSNTRKKGKSLPPRFIIRTGKFVWTTMWQIMMSNLAPRSKSGEYIRPATQFHHSIGTEPDNPYPPATGRYNLYVGLGCPWAHRNLVVRSL